MSSSGQAIPAAPADDVPFAADEFAKLDIVHIAADLLDGADEFVADDQRRLDGLLRPAVPVEDMNICTTNCGLVNLYQDIIAADLWNGDIFHPQPMFGFLFR